MADATLALNPVTPLYNGAVLTSANALPVVQTATTGQGWLYLNTATAGTAIIKASAATLHGITINAVSTLGTWSLIDAAATAATPVIAAGNMSTVTSLFYDANTTTGLVLTTVTTTTAIAMNVTVSYK